MYYGSGTVDRIASRQPAHAAAYAAVGDRQMQRVHWVDGRMK